ncbi:hypothetical protein MMC06_004228 [Schaereria dolodes]|nr:hypothetical protein [Schaereria dolodes]
MDTTSNSIKPSRASGIPRLSRLPLPRPRLTVANDIIKTAEVGNVDTGYDTSKLRQKTVYAGHTGKVAMQPLSDLRATSLDSNPAEPSARPSEAVEQGIDATPTVKVYRRPRQSLSDRTVETLSQIPPSPSPARRKSNFFLPESPMVPSSRPDSALNRSRPSSRAGPDWASADSGRRPVSPYKRPTALSRDENPSLSIARRRVVSSFVPPRKKDSELAIPSIPSTLQQPSLSNKPIVPTLGQDKVKRPLHGYKTFSARSSPKRPPAQDTFHRLPSKNNHEIEQSPTDISKIRSSQSNLSSTTVGDEMTIDNVPTKPQKLSASSHAFRESIAKAKAARRKAVLHEIDPLSVPRALSEDETIDLKPISDPFVFDVLDTNNRGLLKKRINAAKVDGRLNISALGLTSIPEEVLRMYDQDAVDTGGIPWYETVDLTRLLAADNELGRLPDTAFPDSLSHADIKSYSNIFAGIEFLDLHGNILTSLPVGLRCLQDLTSLNLSKNRVSNDSLSLIGEIRSLKELRLAENVLSGPLPEDLCNLSHLQILDLQANKITSLPKAFGQLFDLRKIDISANKLTSLPPACLTMASLVELNASRNTLGPVLVPSSIGRLAKLQMLDVSSNILRALVEGGNLELPSIETVNISKNRFTELPNVSSWTHTSTLIANENQLSSLPDTFYDLKNLKTVDLSGNSMSKVDERFGSMNKLSLLRINSNPLRERKFLSMGTPDILLELRNRSSPVDNVLDTDDGPSGTTGNLPSGKATTSTAGSVNSGTLDRSKNKIRTLSISELEPIVAVQDIKTLALDHNLFQEVPSSIELLGTTLTSLDLSHNKLGQSTDYLFVPFDLPFLLSLNLTSNALTSLSPLISNLSAPKLATLILSFNRLTSLPLLKSAFPSLSTLLASNNAVTDIDVEAVRGLRVFDISSNSVGHLPPKLGLLQGELKTLMVQGNKFRVPGWGVVEKGTEEILSWLRKRIPIDEMGDDPDSVD